MSQCLFTLVSAASFSIELLIDNQNDYANLNCVLQQMKLFEINRFNEIFENFLENITGVIHTLKL